MMNRNSTSPTENSALRWSDPYDAYDISDTMAVVRNRTDPSSYGIRGTLPDTMMIAIASPIARPMPCITAVSTPLRAARSETLK